MKETLILEIPRDRIRVLQLIISGFISDRMQAKDFDNELLADASQLSAYLDYELGRQKSVLQSIGNDAREFWTDLYKFPENKGFEYED